MTIMPRDADNQVIPALRLKSGKAHKIDFSDTSARNSVAFDSATRVVSLYATAPVYLRFGGAAVDAADTDHYFPAGTYYDVAVSGGKKASFTHVAALRVDQDGVLYLSEKE